MPDLSQIVDVQIDRQTAGITQVGFGTLMILGQHTRFAERIRFYESLDGVVADGFLTSDNEYKAAAKAFGQDIKPDRIAIGRRTAPVAQVNTISISSVVNSFAYTVTINGTTVTYTSDADATGAEIQAGLIAAINANSTINPYVTASAGGGTDVVVTSDLAGHAFSISVGTNLSVAATTPNNGIIEDIQAVVNASDDWYCLIITSKLKQEILDAASDIETRKKIFIVSTADTDVRDGTANSVLDLLEALGYDRTGYIYSGDAANYPEASWAGGTLPLDPGSETWKFKEASGNIADTLTTTQQSNIKNINGNTYETYAGVSMFAEGKMVSGEYIDVIRFVDWLEQRMKERIFQALINVPKIPFTDAGVAVIESLVRAQLAEGIAVGGLADDPAPTVTVPLVADVSNLDKANRLLPDVKFNATLAGAIHKTQIRGVVTL